MRFLTLISLFFYANLSFALGLGEAELKSNLSERLLVKLDVSDAESAPDSSCFTATDIGDPTAFKKANITLKANPSGNYQLVVSTHDVISEPIVNLRVSYHCEPNVNRDYVLLLDPIPAPAAEKASTSVENTNNSATLSADETSAPVQKSNKTKKKKLAAEDALATSEDAIPEQPPVKKASKKKKAKTISAVDAKLLEAYTGKQNTNPEPQTIPSPESTNNTNTDAPHKSADKAFLVISAGNANASNGTEQPSLSLRLATEIDVNRPDEVVAAQTSAADAMDEVTVMANRLAHLEKQIASLQTRNAQLVTEAKVAKEETKRFDWMQFSKIALAISLTLAVIELLRRRFAKKQVNEVWFDEEPYEVSKKSSLDTHAEDDFNYNDIKTPSFNETAFNEKPAQNEEVAKAIAFAASTKEESSSIIEDADVFIEHGRPTLAVQLLQNHLSESPAESPAIWLKLLNLLSKEGSEAEYDAAVVECNKYFNIKADKFGSSPTKSHSSIEDYPHIVTRLEGIWGSPYAVGFLNDLIFNKRSQPREGLDQGAFNDLFFLKNIAKNLESIDPTLFKVTPMPSSNMQAKTSEASVVASNVENSNFNDALFTDIEPAAVASPAPKKSKLKDTKRGTISNFNHVEEVHSYEVNMIESDEHTSAFNVRSQPNTELEVKAEPAIDFEVDNSISEVSKQVLSPKDQPLEFDIPEKVSAFDTSDNELFKAEEINFSLPTEKVEYATETKPEALTDEIVFDSPEPQTTASQSLDMEFTLDFPNEENSKANVEKNEVRSGETKTKAKSKPSFKNLSESNEIEWDLPEIDIVPKSGKE